LEKFSCPRHVSPYSGGRVRLSPERGPTACSFRALHCSCTKKVSWGAFVEPARFAPADSVHDAVLPVVSFSRSDSVHRSYPIVSASRATHAVDADPPRFASWKSLYRIRTYL